MGKALSVGHRAADNRFGGCFGWAFSLIFFIVGSVFLWMLAIWPLWQVATSGDWVETPCTILSSKVGVHDGEDGDTYSIDIEYEYVFDDVRRQGDRYSFMSGMSSSGRSGKQAVVRQYPRGKKTVCFVDPDSPDNAVLNRKLTSSMWWGLFPIPFVMVGTGGIVYLIFFRKKGSGEPSEQATDRTDSMGVFGGAGSRSPAIDEPFIDDDSPVELKAEASPKIYTLIFLGISLFWNGIAWTLAISAWREFQAGKGGWFPLVFAIPFVLVGIGLVLATLYFFISIFNPRPVMTLSRRSVPLGGSVTLSWLFHGSVHSIQKLSIFVTGQEEASYRRGTDTHTDTDVFYKDTVFQAEGMMPMSPGEVQIEIPTGLMHSFEANNNEVVWAIEIHGDIRWRPDVKSRFPFQVIPHE